MVKPTRGFRRATRRKLKKRLKSKFKPGNFLQEFKPKDKVIIKQDPSMHRGMPHLRFKGMTGEVREKRGRSYTVVVRAGGIKKVLTVRPEHLKRATKG